MVEIERKFLIDKNKWHPKEKGIIIKQGYLSVDQDKVVRVRTAGENSFLTIKGKAKGITRTELEYEIPKNEAEVLLKMCQGFIIEKLRYVEKINGNTWEIDVFEGDNSGLVLAEIELENENQKFERPSWIGEEVSYDKRFFNSWLSKNPYSRW
jgi:adenylate cyclase